MPVMDHMTPGGGTLKLHIQSDSVELTVREFTSVFVSSLSLMVVMCTGENIGLHMLQ